MSIFKSYRTLGSNPYTTGIEVNEDYIEPSGSRNLFSILGIKTIPFNPNPLGFSNGEDCSVRAICALLYAGKQKVTEKEYKDIYLRLAQVGVEQGRIMNHTWVIAEFLKQYGYTAVQPEDGVTAASFMHAHKIGRYIVSVPTHVFAYINGAMYDLLTMFEQDELHLSSYADTIYCPNDEAKVLLQ